MSMVQYKIRQDYEAQRFHQLILRAYGVDYKRPYWWKKTLRRAVLLPNGDFFQLQLLDQSELISKS